jgi:hypothetical protein
MTRNEIIAAWNAQSDYMNSWQNLGEDEKLEWAMKLEREACAKVCDEYSATGKIEEFDRGWLACAKNTAAAIRARGQA